MTYEQFWEQDCELVKYYRKAAQIRQDLRNQDAWLQGAYFYEALIDAAPVLRAFAKKGTKPTPYREGPYELFSRQDAKGVVNVKRTNPMNVVKRIKGSLTRFLKEEDGVGVVEVVLILVVLIGLIVIFKSKLTVLLNSIFSTITQRTGSL